ncbi:hypothetical protein K8Q93_02340 [Candidatus Parcubacteria bacterium]|nr:hypothetical protein [Candidatus Parcubacteria bacterium]
MYKLNLGCGYDKIPGYENVDSAPECAPDRVVDLEKFPWPWKDVSVEEVLLTHTLEHLGREPEVYMKIWQELWRICIPGARIHIAVPHPRHDNFAHDPTHVRAVTPESLVLLDQALHPQGLGARYGIDFRLIPESVEFFYVSEAAEAVKQGRLSLPALEHLRARQYNVSNEIRMTLEVRKPTL